MTSQDLLRSIYLKITKYKYLVILFGMLAGILTFLYVRTIGTVYSTKASVFPLTASPENALSSNALSSILGLSENSKSFSQDASINIVELALSRNTREAVVMERLPQMENKRIADLLIENYNKRRTLFSNAIKKPGTDAMLSAIGGDILRSNLTAKINKNGILEINLNSTDPALLSPVGYTLIEKISLFYKELKIQKAQFDYEFTIRKVDSLDKVLNSFDRKAVNMSNTTLFVPVEKLQYQIPKENLVAEKERVMSQRDAAANNREEALWRLQKVTPIIATLDKPDPPFDDTKPSSVLYGMVGFLAGIFFSVLFLISGLLHKYTKAEIKKTVFGEN